MVSYHRLGHNFSLALLFVALGGSVIVLAARIFCSQFATYMYVLHIL